MDRLIEETATRIFADHRDTPESLWAALEETGVTRLWVSEEHGGFGMSPVDGFGLIRLAGAHAIPVPLPETLLATWFLTSAGIEPPTGQSSIFIDRAQRGIAFGDGAAHIVRVSGTSVSLHRGLIDKTYVATGADPLAYASSLDRQAQSQGEMASEMGLPAAALARAAQMCGAMEAALTLTIEFAEQRVQFGRSISKFQAIQHLLSEMGAEAAAASAAVDAAIAGVRSGAPLDRQAIAVAKVRANLAAGVVSEHAHQIHGAIGYTQEYDLARWTRRLWQWREDFGGEAYWTNVLGREALAEPGPLWPKLSSPRFDRGGLGERPGLHAA